MEHILENGVYQKIKTKLRKSFAFQTLKISFAKNYYCKNIIHKRNSVKNEQSDFGRYFDADTIFNVYYNSNHHFDRCFNTCGIALIDRCFCANFIA